MAENFPNLKKETAILVQEALRFPNKMNPNRPNLRHIIIKMAKVKDKESILKTARENQGLAPNLDSLQICLFKKSKSRVLR